MHLMTFIHIVQPSRFERFLIMAVQLIFYNLYVFLYLLAPHVAHRLFGCLEEKAVTSYTQALTEFNVGKIEDIEATDIAKEYWTLPADARLDHVVLLIRADEAAHRDTNHTFANAIVDKSVP